MNSLHHIILSINFYTYMHTNIDLLFLFSRRGKNKEFQYYIIVSIYIIQACSVPTHWLLPSACVSFSNRPWKKNYLPESEVDYITICSMIPFLNFRHLLEVTMFLGFHFFPCCHRYHLSLISWRHAALFFQ